MTRTPAPRRAMATIALLIVLAILELAVVGLVLAGGRDHQLSLRRLDTLRAFYAAEGAANMAMRELMLDADEDGDGVAGSISADADAATDPALPAARLHAEFHPRAAGESAPSDEAVLLAVGRAGDAERRIVLILAEATQEQQANESPQSRPRTGPGRRRGPGAGRSRPDLP